MEVILNNVTKSYRNHTILKQINHDFKDNTFTAIKGSSGAGKSTLLNIIGLISEPSSGQVPFDQQIVSNISYSKRARYYRENLNFVFQNFLLVPELSVRENLAVASRFLKINRKQKEKLYVQALENVGLSNINLQQPVYTCSGGEQQRIAIARSFINPAQLILADEPTGSLDHDNGVLVMNLLKELQESGKTIIMVTHSTEFDNYFDDILNL